MTNIFRFLIAFSSVICINSIYVPNSDTNTKQLNTFGIKSLGWQENESKANVIMHHNYSKVNQFNPRQNGDLKINDQLEDFSETPHHIKINDHLDFRAQDNLVYKSCPKGATGAFVYEDSCSQFLNCWKGRGSVQNCAPGTLFNPKTLECDYPEKVECPNSRFSRQIIINSLNQNQIKQPSCPQGFSGLIPHYEICSKYIHCNHGNEIVMDCPAGTNFDSKSNRCDFPYKAECFNGGLKKDEGEIKKKVVIKKYFDDDVGFEFDGVRNDLGFSGVDSNGNKYFVVGGKVNDFLGGEFENQNLNQNLNQNWNRNVNQVHSPHHNLNQNQNHQNQNENLNLILHQRHNFSWYQNQNQNQHQNLNQNQNQHQNLNQNQNQHQNLNQNQNQHQNLNQNQHQNLNQNQYQNQNQHQNINQYHNFNQNQHQNQNQYQNFYQNHNLRPNLNQNQNQNQYHNFNQNQNQQGNVNLIPIIDLNQNQNQYHNLNQNLNQYQNLNQNQNQRPNLNQNVNRVVKCPDGQSGLFPHPYDCKKFLNCDHGRTFIQECGPGTVFNPKLKVCDWPYNVQCNHNEGSDDQRTGKLIGNDQNQNQLEVQTIYGIDVDTFCIARNGFFENLRNCSVFFNCKNGKFSIGICHKGAQFNPNTNDCDEFYRCGGQSNRGNLNLNQDWNQNRQLNQKPIQNWSQNVDQTPIQNWNQNGNQNLNQNQNRDQNYNQGQYFLPTQHWGQNLDQKPILNPNQNLNQNGNFDQTWSENRNFAQKPIQSWSQNIDQKPILNRNQNIHQDLNQNFDQQPIQSFTQNFDQQPIQSFTQNLDQNQINYDDQSTSSKSILSTDTNADYIFDVDDLVEPPPSDNTIIEKKQDCSSNEDESSNCNQNLINEFEKIEKSKMAIKEIAKYSNTSINFCARKCTTQRPCKSFNYRKNDGMCFILDTNLGETGSLFILPNYDYYEYKNFSINCDDKFVCTNRKCIEKHKKCDGKFDCADKEDEKNCDRDKIGYSIQLIGSNKTNEGAVHVKAFNKVGFVCDDQFGLKDADVVCKEIGFDGALEIKSNGFYAIPDEYKDDGYLMDDVHCMGDEPSLKDCDFNGWGNHNCREKEIVGVVCKSSEEFDCPLDKWKCETSNECIPLDFLCDNVDDCSDNSDEASQYCESPTEIRLSNGSRPSQGRLEIKYHGTWGTVCDDDFNDDAAKVVCRYLGFKGSATSHKNGAYGPGKGPIWLDQVFCQGNETTLQECDRWDWGKHNCDHSEDVGIDCDDHKNVKSTPRNMQNIRIKPPKQILSTTCGLRSDNIFSVQDDVHFRVVKGLVAEKGMYPWQASIRVKGQSSQEHWCGAVIVSEKFVLTAGHCLNGYQKGGFVIVAGDYDRNENEGTEQTVNIEEYYVHNEFRKGTKMNNDLALVKLKGDGFRFDEHIRAICLPTINLNEEGLNCSISGFGSIQSGRAVASRELRAGYIPIQPREVCKMPHIYGEALTEGMICAGNLGGGVDACDGDSGGPLACLNDGVFTLVGLTSWGQHCGHANKPGVYVKISYYRDWIDDMMRKHLD